MPEQAHIFDFTPDELAERFAAWGLKRFRAKQVLKWVYARGVADPHQMTDLAKRDRELLAERMTFLIGRTLRHQRASDGTQKLLVDWSDASSNDQTECVMIPSVSRESGKARRTACISSQVGCPVGCRFCASGLGGLDRNLSAGQIVQQAWQLSHQLDAGPITNVVFMGMGEPLANFTPVTRAIRALIADWGMNLSGRRVTLSTVGLPAQIRRLAELELPFTLAISMHAPNDEIRKQIIPWAQFTSLDQLIDAGRYYFDRTGREVTIEYILLGKVNDQPEHARELAQVAKRLRSNVNLIRYNEVAGLPYDRPRDEDVHAFQRLIQRAGISCHIRASRGRDIDAACGQLRHEHQTRAAIAPK